MENNKQRIIFDTPEETTPADVISEILERNGIKDASDDLLEENKIPRLKIVSDALKDLFDKKISEETLVNLLQTKLNVSKENAMGITAGLKEKLIPFGKKIDIPKYTEKPIEEKISNGAESATEKLRKAVPKKNVRTTKKTERKDEPDIPEEIIPRIIQRTGPDSYREPIE